MSRSFLIFHSCFTEALPYLPGCAMKKFIKFSSVPGLAKYSPQRKSGPHHILYSLQSRNGIYIF